MSRSEFGLIFITHGRLGEEMLATIEHVLGKQSHTAIISIMDGDNRDEKLNELNNAILRVDQGNGVVLITDMYGGTPSNIAFKLLPRDNIRALYGANMPALIKLANSRTKSMDEAIAQSLEAGKKYFNSCQEKRGA